MRSWLVILAILSLPVASAGSVPVLGFLSDGEPPVEPGVLTLQLPEGNESSSRPIIADLIGTPTVFAAGDELRAGTHLKGPLFAAIWIDASAVQSGSLSLSILAGQEILAEQSINVTMDPESLPDPESLVPPDPADPEGAVFHLASQVLPAVMQPTMVFNFGIIDVEMPDEPIHAELRLVPDPGDLLAGGSTIIKYDSALSPSYIYLPWWTADPEAESPQQQAFEEAAGSSGGPSGGSGGDGSGGAGSDGSGSDGQDGGSGGSGDKGIPGPAMMLLVIGLAWAVARRR